jgi:hypothetical protein
MFIIYSISNRKAYESNYENLCSSLSLPHLLGLERINHYNKTTNFIVKTTSQK